MSQTDNLCRNKKQRV